MTNEQIAKVSTFYDSLKGAKQATLWYRVNQDNDGPFWTDTGKLVASDDDLEWSEVVSVVDLGQGRYRLARCEDVFSQLRLHWGDEFLGSTKDGQNIQLEKVITPEPFTHFQSINSGPINESGGLSKLIHGLGGGWECSMGGMWLISIPTNQVQNFLKQTDPMGLQRSSR